MRTAVLIFATILALVGGFWLYFTFAGGVGGDVAQGPSDPTPTSRRATVDGSGLPAGEGAWYLDHDDRGRLKSRLRGSRYDPQPDKSLRIESPEAEFFLHDRDDPSPTAVNSPVIRLRAAQGFIHMVENPGSGKSVGPRALSPRSGILSDVEIRMYPTPAATRPTLVARLPLASFDTESFEMNTEPAQLAPGAPVTPADEIPVVVTGDDYDFSGRGLKLRWGRTDGALRLLEIAHGDRLVLKNAASFGPGQVKRVAGAPATGDAGPVLLASAGPGRARSDASEMASVPKPATFGAVAAVPGAPASRPATVTYRAHLYDDVRVLQSPGGGAPQATLAVADILLVDFAMDGDRRRGATRPAVVPGRAGEISGGVPATGAVREIATTGPAREPVAGGRATTGTPATPEPVTVFWTGRLVVQPAAEDVPPAVKPVVTLVATTRPVVVTQQGSRIEAAGARYDTTGESASLSASDRFPVVRLTDSRGTQVATAAMTYSPNRRTALLSGASRARFASTRPTGPPDILTAEWTDTCELQLAPGVDGQLRVRQADLTGAVRIDHPRLKLQSATLSLQDFLTSDTPGKRSGSELPARVVAKGNVRTRLEDADRRVQTIDAETLTIDTTTGPDGAAYPRRVEADGRVVASQLPTVAQGSGDTLKAENLVLDLGPAARRLSTTPSTRPEGLASAVELKGLVARGQVTVAGKDGSSAVADVLTVDNAEPSDPVVTLVGSPAVLADARNTLVGPRVVIHPNRDTSAVYGPGTLSAQGNLQPGSATRPVKVAWTDGITVDGPGDRIDVRGAVSVDSGEADGTVRKATCGDLTLELGPAAPADAKGVAARPAGRAATRPVDSPIATARFLDGKVVRRVVMTQDAKVTSTLPDADGLVLKRTYLTSSRVEYTPAPRRGTDATEKAASQTTGQVVSVPEAGAILYEDYSPRPATRASTRPAGSPAGSADGRGVTRMAWKKTMVFDESARTAVMTGDVSIRHKPLDKPQDKPEEIYNLTADRATARFGRTPAAATRDAPSRDAPPLENFVAEGSVVFTIPGVEMNATTLEFSPATNTVTIRGSPDLPATISQTRPDGQRSDTAFVFAVYDLQKRTLLDSQEVRSRIRINRLPGQ